MKIKRISAYQVDLPLHEGRYAWSGGKSVDVFDSTIVQVETDNGLVGHGEVCPLGPFYLPAYAAGVRTGLVELAPHLIGLDPRQLAILNEHMDRALKGHAYVKSGIDIACWDILGQAAGQPACVLLGGRYGEDFVLYRAISQRPPAEMADSVAAYRAEGYRRFQLKVGSDADTDIERIRAVAAVLVPGDVLIADATTGWLAPKAARVLRALPAGLPTRPPVSCAASRTSTSTLSSPASATSPASRSAAAPRTPSSSTKPSTASTPSSPPIATTPWMS